jgi:YegS/Rv2252/BmrU family lipid kinase
MTQIGKLWVILNPVAGKGKAAAQQPKIEQFLREKGRDFEVLLTKGVGDALEITRKLLLRENDAVIAAGGDGTCNEVVNGLLTRNPAPDMAPIFGILPVGRGNDFAYSPGIPNDLDKALEILNDGKLRPLDAGFVKGGFFPDGRYFVNGVGIGFDTKVGFDAAKMKIKSGLAYVLGAVINIIRYDPSPLMKISYNGKEVTFSAAIVSVVNGRRMGGVFYMGPNALLDDGLFDICSVRRPKSRLRLMYLVLQYTKGAQGRCKEVFMDRAAHYHLTALEGGMAAHADGETLCYDGKELDITCHPSALRLIGA